MANLGGNIPLQLYESFPLSPLSGLTFDNQVLMKIPFLFHKTLGESYGK